MKRIRVKKLILPATFPFGKWYNSVHIQIPEHRVIGRVISLQVVLETGNKV
jgi:hypothetical protein